jgi:hypothetical protein
MCEIGNSDAVVQGERRTLGQAPSNKGEKLSRVREIACTVPTQPKTAYLSLDKSVVFKNQLALLRMTTPVINV